MTGCENRSRSMRRQTPAVVISSGGAAEVERSKTLENLFFQISPLASLGRDDTERVLYLQFERLRKTQPLNGLTSFKYVNSIA